MLEKKIKDKEVTDKKLIEIKTNIINVESRILKAIQKANRKRSDILLLAVSKTHNEQAILQAYDQGICDFGENYLQEALTKIEKIKKYHTENKLQNKINWHFIGHIQSNKTKLIAENFNWVHTVERLKILKRLDEQRPKNLKKLNICFEINLDNEPTKSGFLLNHLDALYECIDFSKTAKNIQLRGLMSIPKKENAFELQYTKLHQLDILKNHLNKKFNLKLDTLSIGMSNDLEAAVQANSTILRIGSAIFGQRN